MSMMPTQEEILNGLRQRVADLERELSFYRRASKAPEGREELRELKEQSERSGTLAGKQAYINALEYYLSLLGSNESAGLRQTLKRLHEAASTAGYELDDDWKDHPWFEELFAANEQARAALSSRSDGWISVKERLPPEERYGYLLYSQEDEVERVGYRIGDKFYVGGLAIPEHVPVPWAPVTHWRPLPPPPASPQEGPLPVGYSETISAPVWPPEPEKKP